MDSIRLGFWYMGIVGWLFGLTERTFSAVIDSYLSTNDLILIFTASFFCVIWVLLFPISNHD